MNLLFDFTVDKATATICITREFAADLDLVWDAFTKSDILDRWSAPKPFKARTKMMDFRPGGRWVYGMVSPENVAVGYSLVEFIEIHPKTSFSGRNSFCDENGDPVNTGITTGITYSHTSNYFEAGNEITTVKIVKKMANLAQLEQFIAMGFREGMKLAMAGLEEYFLTVVSGK